MTRDWGEFSVPRNRKYIHQGPLDFVKWLCQSFLHAVDVGAVRIHQHPRLRMLAKNAFDLGALGWVEFIIGVVDEKPLVDPFVVHWFHGS
jgi:hypothetical protein